MSISQQEKKLKKISLGTSQKKKSKWPIDKRYLNSLENNKMKIKNVIIYLYKQSSKH